MARTIFPTPVVRSVTTGPRSQFAPLLATRSDVYRDAVTLLERYAKHDQVPVLLVGESGTGKSIFAEHLHACSPRANRVFHRVALSAVTDAIASSDLFGHLQGAFTDARSKRAGHFVAAHGGTLFLDEIGKASAAVQRHLLDVVERKEISPLGADRPVSVDVRLVAATNVPLHSLADDGTFLPDLLARLDGFVVRIPPLRERRDDIPLLATHLVAKHASAFGYATPPAIEDCLMSALRDAAWPGNVRELDVAIRRLLIECDGGTVIALRHCVDSLAYFRRAAPRLTAEDIATAVRAEGNVAAVARRFGMSRTTVYRHMKRAADGGATVTTYRV